MVSPFLNLNTASFGLKSFNDSFVIYENGHIHLNINSVSLFVSNVSSVSSKYVNSVFCVNRVSSMAWYLPAAYKLRRDTKCLTTVNVISCSQMASQRCWGFLLPVVSWCVPRPGLDTPRLIFHLIKTSTSLCFQIV